MRIQKSEKLTKKYGPRNFHVLLGILFLAVACGQGIESSQDSTGRVANRDPQKDPSSLPVAGNPQLTTSGDTGWSDNDVTTLNQACQSTLQSYGALESDAACGCFVDGVSQNYTPSEIMGFAGQSAPDGLVSFLDACTNQVGVQLTNPQTMALRLLQ